MKTKRIHFYFLAAILSILLSSSASAQLTKLNVGYSAISAEQLPAWIAKETGIFKKNGLDVQLIYFTGGTTAVQALVSGPVDSSLSRNRQPDSVQGSLRVCHLPSGSVLSKDLRN
jgi:NitT/TauT family transport system substrate-binding protein